MTYKGPERRADFIEAGKMLTMCESIARTEAKVEALDRRINGSLDAVKTHIENGGKWRVTIFTTAVGLLLALGSGIYAYGLMTKQVTENTKDIGILAEYIKKVVV